MVMGGGGLSPYVAHVRHRGHFLSSVQISVAILVTLNTFPRLPSVGQSGKSQLH